MFNDINIHLHIIFSEYFLLFFCAMLYIFTKFFIKWMINSAITFFNYQLK